MESLPVAAHYASSCQIAEPPGAIKVVVPAQYNILIYDYETEKWDPVAVSA